MQNKKVLWRALSKSKADGYGYASYRISSGLRDAGIPLFEPEDFLYLDAPEKDLCISLEHGLSMIPTDISQYADITINNCLPIDFKYGKNYNIGFSYWETDKLPSNWIPKLQNCDEVWTTSKWAGEVFRSNTGMDNVHSFRLGIESDIFYTSDSVPEGPFTFLHVGSPSTRKNTQMAFEAFLRTYGAKKDYRMIIKSLGPPDARFTDGVMKLGPVTSHDRIDVIDWEMTEDELADLYRSVHCLVYPTRGEGWGMIPFNTIASGTPTICTNATSCTEYAELSVPLDYNWSSENTFGIYKGGSWADPDFDDLCDKMRYVVDNYQEVKQKTLKGAKIIHKEYSWSSVVKEYKDRLCQI